MTSNLQNDYLVQINPGEPLPFVDDTFSSVSAYDVLEHLPRTSESGNTFIFYMNELYRVLKPGGTAIFIFPGYPSMDAFSDPTHVNYITKESVNFFLATPGGPYYENITCAFKLIKNSKLRSFKKWVNDPEVYGVSEDNIPIRRKMSLMKRTLKRFIFPAHRIWILQK